MKKNSCALCRATLVVTCFALWACGDTGSPSRQPAAPVVDLLSDNNRNGIVDLDDPSEQAGEETWSRDSGAVFLINLDDDDGDGIADNQDELVNGPADELDLARVIARPWPAASQTASGTVELDLAARGFVRVFQRTPAGWVSIDTNQPLSLSTADLQAGVELGIEGRDFVRSENQDWQGLATLTFSVSDAAGPIGEDTVQLRAAPWLMNHNLRPFDTVYFSDFSPDFVATMTDAVEGAGLTVQLVPDSYVDGSADIWFEDWFQTGWTGMPAKDGGGHVMKVFNPRPWGRDENPDHLPLAFLKKHMLGPERAVAVLFDEATELGTGSTYDSHGNHEALPPYPAAPAGRLLLGAGIKQSTRDFYAAQQVQPPIYLDTSWLVVGHMDEVYGAVRAATPRGFKMIQNSPALCKTLFEKWQAEGHGDAPIFEGKVDFEAKQWQTTVAEVLGDATMMGWNQEAQLHIEEMHATLAERAGLTEEDFVEVPVFYEEIDGGKIAYLPDTANIRVIANGNTAVFAQTFGPMVGGEDVFAKELLARLEDPAMKLGSDGNGLDVRFADSWNYHVLLGDVHCASNWSALPTPAEPKWWDAANQDQGM
ncbi:MAG: hypothetical protein IPI67_23915 [Myxococcales bacterium]|nr:hypothetical protein [Myxococcales bacterium]